MKLAVALLIVALLGSCAQVGRRPASYPSPSKCEAAFESVTQDLTVTSRRYSDLETIRKGYEYLERWLPEEINELLKSEKPACQRARDFADMERDLKVKLATVAQTSRALAQKELELEELNNSAMMADPAFKEKALCVLNCGTAQENRCTDICGVEQDFIDHLADNEIFMRLYNLCLPQVPEFSRLLAERLPRWRQRLNLSLWPAYRELSEAAKKASRKLAELQAQLKSVKRTEKNTACDLPLPGWRNKARSAMDIVKGEGGQGTAFYISVGENEHRVVTAEHIHSRLDDWGHLDTKPLIFGPTNGQSRKRHKPVTRQITPEPGLFSRGADVVQTRVAEPGRSSLGLIEITAVPEPGQTFYLAGFPKARDYRYTLYRCTFYGFGPSKVEGSTSSVYILRCPGVDGHIAGMSGGPVLDEQGRVWGLITDHNTFLARVYVSPLSISADHEVHMGIQQYFLSDFCLSEHDLVPSRCQVMPNQYERAIP